MRIGLEQARDIRQPHLAQQVAGLFSAPHFPGDAMGADLFGDLLADGYHGFSAAIGSWKIMAISRPRRWRIASGGSCSKSAPSKTILPPVRRHPAWQQSHHRMRVSDLPEPDSPTMQTISLRPTSRLTSSTARAGRRRRKRHFQILDGKQRHQRPRWD